MKPALSLADPKKTPASGRSREFKIAVYDNDVCGDGGANLMQWILALLLRRHYHEGRTESCVRIEMNDDCYSVETRKESNV